MARAERPSALLERLGRVSPLVRRALFVAVFTGVVTTLAIVVQAVALSSALAAMFHNPHARIVDDVARFLIATLARGIAVAMSEPVTAHLARPLRRELRRRALANVLAHGPARSVDATVQLCTRGVDAIESYVARYVPSLTLSVLAPITFLGWLAIHDRLSALIIGVSVLLLPVFMALLGFEARDKMAAQWREQQRLAGYFGDVVRGMTVLKAFNRSDDALDSLDDVGAAVSATTMSTLRVAFLSGFALELLSSLATALVALVLGLRLINGSVGLNVALAVLLLTPEVFLPLRRSAAQYHASTDGIAAATELLDILNRPAIVGDRAAPTSPPSIELRGVRVAHDGRVNQLSHAIDVVVPSGGVAIVTGPSGSGKTSILRVIAGLRTPSDGRVLIDGGDLADLDIAQWRDRVAWLPQEPSLPGASVRDVVQMGDASIGDDRIFEALTLVGLDLALDRPLGEGSLELSAGQRRRLALVRCLVRRPLVLLLDEPTAHLDDESAGLVTSAIEALTMTRVIATHRHFDADVRIDLGARSGHGC